MLSGDFDKAKLALLAKKRLQNIKEPLSEEMNEEVFMIISTNLLLSSILYQQEHDEKMKIPVEKLKYTTECMTTICSFLEFSEQLQFQLVSRDFYERVIPSTMIEQNTYPFVQRYQLALTLITNFSKKCADVFYRAIK